MMVHLPVFTSGEHVIGTQRALQLQSFNLDFSHWFRIEKRIANDDSKLGRCRWVDSLRHTPATPAAHTHAPHTRLKMKFWFLAFRASTFNTWFIFPKTCGVRIIFFYSIQKLLASISTIKSKSCLHTRIFIIITIFFWITVRTIR